MLLQAESDQVALTLSPEHAHRLAATLQLQLALQLERTEIGTVPGRRELERTRRLLDHYCCWLDMLHWGGPRSDVHACFACGELRLLMEDMQQGADECHAIGQHEDGSAMDATAQVLADALERRAQGAEPVMAAK